MKPNRACKLRRIIATRTRIAIHAGLLPDFRYDVEFEQQSIEMQFKLYLITGYCFHKGDGKAADAAQVLEAVMQDPSYLDLFSFRFRNRGGVQANKGSFLPEAFGIFLKGTSPGPANMKLTKPCVGALKE
jgi:hypothetical protein